MTSFDDRKNASETRFVMDAAKEFKSEARRNKALGHWAAGLMGKTAAEADSYALEVIVADMEEAGDDDVYRKLRSDLTAAGIDLSDQAIRDRMAEELKLARDHVYAQDLNLNG
ncbi:MAG: DUF1476 domain-containing protein [Litorimonas sp.]